MNKRMTIAFICLLISVLIPSVGMAKRLLYTYPLLRAEIWDGMTTNEMAYVDQFYNEDGSFSEEGKKLLHWLDMTPKSQYDRNGSGYLMLEQEIEHQATSGIYKIGSKYVRGARFALNTVGSFGVNILTGLAEEAGFQSRFPGAGKSAYIYYNNLYQIYFDYVNALQTRLIEADQTINSVADQIGTLTEFVTENHETYVKRAYVQFKHRDAIAIVPDNYMKKVTTFDVVDIEYKTTIDLAGVEHKYNIMFVTETPSGRVKRTIDDLLRPTAYGDSVVWNTTKLKMDNNLVDELVSQELSSVWDIDAVGNLKLTQLSAAHASGVLQGAKYAEGYSELSGSLKQAFNKAEDLAKESIPSLKATPEKGKVADTIGKIADLIGTATEIQGYFQHRESITLQQQNYLTVISQVTQEYVDMLEQWGNSLWDSNVDDKEDINAAISAILIDILEVHNATMEELKENAAEDAFVFTLGDLTKTINSIAETICTFSGAKDILSTVKNPSQAQMALAVVSIGSMVLDNMSETYVDFGDNSSTVYNLKWSLYNLLTEDYQGYPCLLTQYRENRTHETACAIISALDTMKSAKYIGECLVEEYYLFDLYQNTGIEISGPEHLVLWGELMQSGGFERLDATDTITPVIGVYEAIAEHTVEPDTSYAGDKLLSYYDVVTEVLGYYLHDNSSYASYLGVSLKSLPMKYKGIPSTAPQYDATAFDRGTRINQDWLNGKIPKERNIDQVYKDEQMFLYSREGIELILTKYEYQNYLKLEMYINGLFDTYGKMSTDIAWYDWNGRDEQQYQRRIEWTRLTKKWIESFKMYDPSVPYMQK